MAELNNTQKELEKLMWLKRGQAGQGTVMQQPQLGADYMSHPTMTPELAAQRAAQRGPMEDASFMGNIGATLNQTQADPGRAGRFQQREEQLATPYQAPPTYSTGRGGARRGADLSIQLATPQPTAPSIPTQPATPQPTAPSIPQGEAGSPQQNYADFLSGGGIATPEQLSQASQFAQSMGTTFDPATGYARVAQPAQPSVPSMPQQGNAPMGVEATQKRLGELFGTNVPTTLNQGNQAAATANLSEGQAAFDLASAEREARLDQRPDFGTAVSDADRRAARGEGLSMEQATRLTGGDRDAARAMIERQKQGMGEFAQEKPMTEKEQLQIEEQKKRNEILDQQIEAGRNPQATASDKKLGEQAALWKSGQADGTLEQWEVDAQRKDFYKKPAPAGYRSWVEYEAEQRGTEGDPVATKADAAQATETQSFASVEEAEAANLPKGTKITINGRTATVQ